MSSAPYYDDTEPQEGRYDSEYFERGVEYGIDLAIDKDAAGG